MVFDTQEATRRVTLVAQTAPEQLPQCPEFAWTAPLSAEQRQRLHTAAIDALDAEAECRLDASSRIVDLHKNMLTAHYLLDRPEIARTLPADWDVDDAWFWTPEWQAGEREADEDIAAGRTTGPMSAEEFLADLGARAGLHADVRYMAERALQIGILFTLVHDQAARCDVRQPPATAVAQRPGPLGYAAPCDRSRRPRAIKPTWLREHWHSDLEHVLDLHRARTR